MERQRFGENRAHFRLFFALPLPLPLALTIFPCKCVTFRYSKRSYLAFSLLQRDGDI